MLHVSSKTLSFLPRKCRTFKYIKSKQHLRGYLQDIASLYEPFGLLPHHIAIMMALEI